MKILFLTLYIFLSFFNFFKMVRNSRKKLKTHFGPSFSCPYSLSEQNQEHQNEDYRWKLRKVSVTNMINIVNVTFKVAAS